MLRPSSLIVVPAAISTAVWIFPWPDSVRRGFSVREDLTSGAVAFLVAWYGMLAMCATFGWLLGRKTKPSPKLDAAPDESVYRLLTWVGLIGVVGMYALVEVSSPGLIAQAFSSRQFNLVREAVPAQAGLATLRYATVLTGAIAMHRRFILKEKSKVHLMNMALLVASSLVASRLSIIMAVLLLVALAARSGNVSIKPKRLVAVGLIALIFLGYANFLRNANYYEARGTTNPAAMMLSEVVAYVGSPAQVAARAAQGPIEVDQPEFGEALATTITPTFLTSSPPPDVARATLWYRSNVDIEPVLTTVSTLAALYPLFGGWSFVVMGIICMIAGLVMGHMGRYRNYMFLGSFVAGYCFVEVWRTYIANAGIIWFIILVLVASCAMVKKPAKTPGQK